MEKIKLLLFLCYLLKWQLAGRTAEGKKSCLGGLWESNSKQAAREKVSQRKTKLICCQGVQHGKKRHAQQWCLIVLFILSALFVARQKKNPTQS